MSEKKTTEEPKKASPVAESSSATDFALPFRVLITPLKTFGQLAQRPTAKGLITLSVLILAITAAAQYASATKIFLTVNGQPASLLASDGFAGWFGAAVLTSSGYAIMYWLVLVVGLALISRTVGGKDVSLRGSLVILGYLLSVFVVIYTVRTIMYLALPSIVFPIGSWPPVDQVDVDAAVSLITRDWDPLLVYQFGKYFTVVGFGWLAVLGTIAVKQMREISWTKASIVSVVGFMFTFFLFGLP